MFRVLILLNDSLLKHCNEFRFIALDCSTFLLTIPSCCPKVCLYCGESVFYSLNTRLKSIQYTASKLPSKTRLHYTEDLPSFLLPNWSTGHLVSGSKQLHVWPDGESNPPDEAVSWWHQSKESLSDLQPIWLKLQDFYPKESEHRWGFLPFYQSVDYLLRLYRKTHATTVAHKEKEEGNCSFLPVIKKQRNINSNF